MDRTLFVDGGVVLSRRPPRRGRRDTCSGERCRPQRRQRPHVVVVFASARESSSGEDSDHRKAIDRVQRMAGKPEVVEDLKSAFWEESEEAMDTQTKVDLTAAAFPFELDGFQLKAIEALNRGESAVVSAPTGSGKTVIGEAAVYLALANGMRAFYTTPLKALSNQKFSDFKKQFGEDRVGLLTGDVSTNREADVVVMTTEVYRNMLYATESGMEVSGEAPRVLDDVFAVVFDEFHFMNDRERGTVWEESVIISPKRTLLVALSATMRNVEDVRAWFQAVHGPTELVVSTYRPVPLEFMYCNRNGIFSLYGAKKGLDGKPMINPKVLSKDVVRAAAQRVENRGYAGEEDPVTDRRGKIKRGNRRATPTEIGKELHFMLEDGVRRGKKLRVLNTRASAEEIPSFGYLLRGLQRRAMLPAIVFLFSRNGCDQAANMVRGDGRAGSSLMTPEEEAEVDRRLLEFEQAHPGLVGDDKLKLARQGIASHHAGILPLWKAVVEELFQDGLIKIVFATETLAAGINMPARTTAITALSKRAGSEGIVDLTTSEVLQMAGRAGRRGKDKKGTCVIIRSHFEGAEIAYHVLNSEVDALNSTFQATYGMVLNLLRRRDLEGSRQLLERSFGAFLMRRERQVGLAQGGGQTNAEKYVTAMRLLEGQSTEPIQELIKLSDRLKTEVKVLRKLIDMYVRDELEEMQQMLTFLQPGTPVAVLHPDADMDAAQVRTHLMGAATGMAIEDKKKSVAEKAAKYVEFAVSLGRVQLPIEQAPFLALLMPDNEIRLAQMQQILHADFETKVLPKDISVSPDSWTSDFVPSLTEFEMSYNGQYRALGLAATAEFASQVKSFELPPMPGHVVAQTGVVKDARNRVLQHEVYKLPNRSELVRAFKAVRKNKRTFTEKQLNVLERKLQRQQKLEETNWKDFLSAAAVLTDFGFLTSDHKLTEIGKLGASLRSQNELWVSIVLMSSHLADLLPHQLAGVLSALLAEGARREQVITFVTSPETVEAVEELVPQYETLVKAQKKRKLQIAVTIDPSDAGLVEAWANGLEWSEMMSGTNLQEGDVCRRLRRVMDLLRQIPRLPLVAEDIKLNAKRALTLMDRFPVADDVTYSVSTGYKNMDLEETDEATEEEYIESIVSSDEFTESVVVEEDDSLDSTDGDDELDAEDVVLSDDDDNDDDDDEDETELFASDDLESFPMEGVRN